MFVVTAASSAFAQNAGTTGMGTGSTTGVSPGLSQPRPGAPEASAHGHDADEPSTHATSSIVTLSG